MKVWRWYGDRTILPNHVRGIGNGPHYTGDWFTGDGDGDGTLTEDQLIVSYEERGDSRCIRHKPTYKLALEV